LPRYPVSLQERNHVHEVRLQGEEARAEGGQEAGVEEEVIEV